MGTLITSYKKSSPVPEIEDLDNYKNVQQIITNDFNEIEVDKLIEELKKELGLEVERTNIHNAGKHQGHYHIFIKNNGDMINKSVIKKVINKINKNIELEKEQENMLEMEIFDNSLKGHYELEEKQLNELLKKKEESYVYVKNDKALNVVKMEGFTGDKKLYGNNPTGLGKFDRPWNIINGVKTDNSKYISRIELDFNTEKEDFNELINDFNKHLEEELESLIGEKIVLSHSNYRQKDNSISFNNLFTGEKSKKIYSLNKHYLQKTVENIFTKIQNENEIIIDCDYKWNNPNIIKEKIENSDVPSSKEEQEEIKEIEVKEDSTFTNQVKGLNKEELEAIENEIITNIEKLKSVEGIIPSDILKEKLEQEENRLSIIKKEYKVIENFNKLEEELENQKQENEKTTKSLYDLKESYKSLEEENKSNLEEIEVRKSNENELSKLNEKLITEKVELENQKSAVEKELGETQSKNEILTTEKVKLEKEKVELEKSNNELEIDLYEEQNKNKKLEKNLNQLEEDYKKLFEENDTLKKKNKFLEKEITVIPLIENEKKQLQKELEEQKIKREKDISDYNELLKLAEETTKDYNKLVEMYNKTLKDQSKKLSTKKDIGQP